eukprot:c10575_g1_i1.p1 GENE.c10575_g1_i1~~c10575_g1_i1.p1  ORF type:complete len:439 (-),score=155.04 c10575_g1_i1:25-1341(-)
MCATKSNTIQKIESLLNYIIQYNSHQSRINCVTSIQSSHNSPFTEPWEHETITFEQFTQETSVLATFDDQCYIYAFSLLKKIELHHQLVLITQQTVHRLFFACLVLAFKFMQDGRYADSEFAMLGGFRSQMLISMQIWIFKALKFNCFIDKKSFQLMGSRLRKLDLSLQSNSYSNYNNEPQFMTLSWLLERKEVTGQFTQHQHQHHSHKNHVHHYFHTTHVIFDMDGLLLDTESFYTIAQTEMLSKYNKTFTWELKSKMMGKKAIEAAKIAVEELELQEFFTPQSYLEEREAILDKMFPECNLMKGVEKFVKHLHKHKIPIAIATSSHSRHFDLKTQKHKDLFKLFDHIVTGDAVQKGKPDPEIYLLACQKFSSPPVHLSRVLVFEDAPIGVMAGINAGMKVVMIPDPQVSLEQRKIAHDVLDSFESISPEKFGLPPY